MPPILSARRLRPVIFLLFISGCPYTGQTQQWIPDSTFGQNSLIQFGFGQRGEIVDAIAVQPDGKIIVTGIYSNKEGPILARYLPDGHLDSSFGFAGKIALFKSNGSSKRCRDLLLLPDGKILLTTSVQSASSNDTVGFGLFRFQTNGLPDSSFGIAGMYYEQAGLLSFDVPRCMALLPDGRILVGGYSALLTGGFEEQPFICRFLPDGSRDSSFGNNGTASLPQDKHQFDHLAIQPDGRIVATGSFFNNNYVLARFMPDGTPDTSFGQQGAIKGGPDQQFGGVHVLPDGRILTGGWQYSPSLNALTGPALRQFLPDGTPDPSFGVNGVAVYPSMLINLRISDMLVQPDGKVLLNAHEMNEFPNYKSTLFRFLPDGQIDPSFVPNGVWLSPAGTKGGSFITLTMVSGSKILLGGAAQTGGSLDFTLMQLLEDGAPDNGFGANGVVSQDFSLGTDEANQIVVHSDGQYSLAGHTTNESGSTGGAFFTSVTRLTSSGQLDSSFNGAGQALIQPTGNLVHVALQPDGKMLVGYLQKNLFGSIKYAVCRLNTNGGIDSTFGTGGWINDIYGNMKGGKLTQIAIAPDGKILIAGDAQLPGTFDRDWQIMRFNPDGTPDLFFGSGGTVLLKNLDEDNIYGLCVQLDGKIIAGGNGRASGYYQMVLARLLPDGTLDNSFGVNGKIFTDFGDGQWKGISQMMLQPDLRLLVASSKKHTANPQTYVRLLSRFTPTGAPDSEFGTGGAVVDAPPTPAYTPFKSIHLLETGKVRAIGFDSFGTNDYKYTSLSVRQFTASGAPDTAAQVHATRLEYYGLPYTRVSASSLLKNNQCLIAGDIGYPTGNLLEWNREAFAARYSFIPGCIPLSIQTPEGDFVEETKVFIQPGGAPDSCQSDSLTTGCSTSAICPCGRGKMDVRPYKNHDPQNGVSTFDLVLINQHILGLKPFSTPWQYIAADINGNGKVTALDLVELRKLILGITTAYPANTSWRFVRQPYTFPNPADPSTPPFPERDTIDASDPQRSISFSAVKIGDIDGGYSNDCSHLANNEDRGNFPLEARWPSNVPVGTIIIVPVQASVENRFTSLQMEWKFDTRILEFIRVEPGKKITAGPESYALMDGQPGCLRFVWFEETGHSQSFQTGEALIYLVFRVRTQPDKNETLLELNAGDHSLVNQAYSADGAIQNLTFHLKKEEKTENEPAAAMLPNPAYGAARLQLYGCQTASGTLYLHSTDGVLQLQAEVTAPMTEVHGLADLPRGIYYWFFQSGTSGQQFNGCWLKL